MLRNYFKTAWRNIGKYKGYFALNFIGLYIGVVASLLIVLIIRHETSFDKRVNSPVSLYRIVVNNSSASGTTNSPVTQYPLAAAMRAAMPGQKLISQLDFEKECVISIDNKKFKETNIVFADSVFPRLFPLTVKQGSIRRALAEPGFAILTEHIARKYFGNENPVGRRIKISNLVDLEIAAVINDAPTDGHLPYNMLIPYASLKPEFIGGFPLDQWSINADGFTYIGLAGPGEVPGTEAGLASIANEHLNDKKDGTKTTYHLQPLSDIHYNQLYAAQNPSYTINVQYLYLIGAIALFLTLAACINYTNLSNALAVKKSREVGVRKVMGANRANLIRQFLTETGLFTAIVFLGAILSVRPLLPALNIFLEKNIPLNWLDVNTIVFLFCGWIGVSLLSGLYPAFLISRFNPISALKNKPSPPKSSAVTLKRGLVVFQFVTAQILIIGTIVVARQMRFVQSLSLGFNKEHVVDIGLPENKPEQLKRLQDRFSDIPGLSSVSFSLGAPVSDNNAMTGFNLKEKYATEKIGVSIKAVDKGYLKTYGLELKAGRWFDGNDERSVDSNIPDSLKKYVVLLNETAVKSLGFSSADEALGKYVKLGINDISAPVIGVVKDYNTATVHEAVKPVLMIESPFFYFNAGIKLSGANGTAALAAVAKAWESVYPQHVFEESFLDEHIASLYKNENRTRQLLNIFTALSVVINILGLIGLISFMIDQKTKDIGVRKVLGASMADISFILSKDYIILMVIAFFIAAPVSWILMNKWLQDFAYRTSISWWVFAFAFLSILMITFISVGFQTIKAALANPIRSLKSE